MASVLKDLRSERPRYTEKDNLRLLFLTKWFLEFFLLVREQQEQERKQRALFSGSQGVSLCLVLIGRAFTESEEVWPFGYVSEVVEHAWAPWVLRRMRAAVEEKVRR
jgi:replication fork protection complex subunit Tof1/Swi1